MDQSLRYGLIIAGSLIVAFLALRLISRGASDVGSAASRIERKL